MADKRISDLNALTVTASTDTALVSDTSASETKKITDYQSANTGAVSDATNPDTIHTVADTPTRVIS